MSTYGLQQLLSPRSVALIGASARPGSMGAALLNNLKQGGFSGPIYPVNPRYKEIDGLPCVAAIGDLADTPDLIIIATPASTVPSLVEAAGEKGVGAAIIVTAGLGHGPDSLKAQSEMMARRTGVRLLGPNCLGLIAPHARLNASFAARMPAAGHLAVISQSGAIAAAIAEWGITNATGFAAIASIGDQVDVDIGDLLDYFALDSKTRAILLYIESISRARKFMSAARAAARTKPVVVIKAGRHAEGAQAAATHTGAMAGSDAVYGAAFRRAGLLRVYDMDELFDAAETLSHVRHLKGNRLAILTNGGGIGVLAIDRLRDMGGTVAAVSPETKQRLDSVLPSTWSGANPVDIVGDAGPDRYVAALDALLADPANDAVLVFNVPTAMASPRDVAQAVADKVASHRSKFLQSKPVFVSWIGADQAIAEIFNAAAIPYYETEVEAVRGAMHLVHYQEAISSLMETPPSLPDDFRPDEAVARSIIDKTLSDGRRWLDPLEVAALMGAYGIEITPTHHAADPDVAVRIAAPLLAEGKRVVLKIHSRDIVHKSDVGGVRVGLSAEDEVARAASEIYSNAKRLRPDARLEGLIVQPMIQRKHARELILGIATDPVFGPVILFGRGGTAVEVINDKALALPPLDLNLANDLISQTRVSRILSAYRDVPAARREDIALTLVKISQLAADHPEIDEIDINPLLADEHGVLALDARVSVSRKQVAKSQSHLAIRPYPREWERVLQLAPDWPIKIRPVRPEDEGLFTEFFSQISNGDLRLRFFAPIKDFSHSFIARLTQIDYARAMAFVAIEQESGKLLGAVRLHADANHEVAEYAILVRSDLKGRGLGWKLMEMVIEYAKADGIKLIRGEVLRENTVMLRMCEELGFDVSAAPDDPGLSIVSYRLQ
jgi:acetyltransferase